MNIELAKEEKLSPGDLQKRINESVEEINRLLEENREKIKALNARLRYSGRQNSRLQVSMEELQQSSLERQAQIFRKAKQSLTSFYGRASTVIDRKD